MIISGVIISMYIHCNKVRRNLTSLCSYVTVRDALLKFRQLNGHIFVKRGEFLYINVYVSIYLYIYDYIYALLKFRQLNGHIFVKRSEFLHINVYVCIYLYIFDYVYVYLYVRWKEVRNFDT
jgi:hypothetical protein